MNKHLLINLLAVLLIFFFPFISNGQNSTCDSTMLVVEGTYEVANFTGNGAVFQGATAAAWYRFEPTTDGVFTVSSCGGGGDTRLVIMFLDDCTNPSNLQIINSAEDNCADGNGGNTASTIEVAASAGFSYVIYWDNGQSNDGFTWELGFETVENSVEGATCETAISITNGIHQVDSLIGIGAAFSDAVSAKWYQYTPETNHVLGINSCESEVNTRLFVFEGGCEISQIIAQNDDGCSASGASMLEEEVIVDSGQVYYIYWDDHWSKAGFNFELAIEDIPVTIDDPIWAEELIIYPNPVNNLLSVQYDFIKETDVKMTIFNNIGQVVLQENWQSFNHGIVPISTNELPEGVYFLNLLTNEEQLTRSFVVER